MAFSNATNTLSSLYAHFERSMHSSPKTLKTLCVYMHQLAPEKRCDFIRNSHCDDLSELILYHDFMFCHLPNPSFVDPVFIAVIVVMFLWLLMLFLVLATIADDFFCPALGTISKMLKLSENLAGVTLLAMGNGAPDIMSSVSAATEDTILMYNQLLGASMFVSGLIAGIIAYARPFNLQPFPFIRDTVFLLGSVIWIQWSTRDEEVTLREAISYIAIYILYMVVVIGGYLIQEKVAKYVKIDDATDVDWDELRRRSLESLEGISILGIPEEQRHEEHAGCKTLFTDTLKVLKPFGKEEWEEMSLIEKIGVIIKCPILIILKLLIPVVNMGEFNNGWCKLLNTMHCLFFPTYFTVLIKMPFETIFGVPIYVVTIAIGVTLALFVFFTSKQTKAPPYHQCFAIIGFLGSITTMFVFVKEVVAVLNLFGTLLDIKIQTLGLTVLAWGNSIGDAIANTSVARQGFQRMAFAGCFGGPIGNTLLSMGITFLILNLSKKDQRSQVRGGVMGPVCSTFLIINISYSIFYVLLTNFEARKSYGIFLILIYLEFLIFIACAEIGWIHPLGTDHEYDVDFYDEHLQKKS